MTVKVVTDSTADLPDGLIRELGITVVPLNVNFGTKSFRDGIDITADEFYRRLPHTDPLPTTSQPTPADFIHVYEELGKETSEIISIHISQKLSGTHNSATLAHAGIKTASRIEIVDSFEASGGLGLIVVQAAKAAKRGANLDEVLSITRDTMSRTHFFGTVDTLRYLHKGGRIGKAQALMGTLLAIKPIIGMREGEVHPFGKARTRKKVIAHFIEMVKELMPIDEMTVLHSTTPEEAAEIMKELASIAGKECLYDSRIGPVIGTYLGPGALGIGVIRKP
ncbi:MAG: DegV family protein [Chloroflexi bacterium]|nr:DegV family protein [Chloroflexota bacterium]